MKQIITILQLSILTALTFHLFGQNPQLDLINDRIELLKQNFANPDEYPFTQAEYLQDLQILTSERDQLQITAVDQKRITIDQKRNDQLNIEQDFETRLNYVRGIMVDRNEQTMAGLAQVKVDKALHGFLQTDFMRQYRDLKVEAESLAATFKALGMKLKPSEVARVRKAYTEVADEFNRFLVDIKRDFMDRKKLKMIRTNKEMYANSLQYKLRELQDMYAQDFEAVAVEVSGSDVYALPLTAILGLIKLAADFADFIVRSNLEARRVKEDHLNQFLLQPYSFRSWFEIETIEGNLYPEEDMYPQDFAEDQDSLEDMDPFMDDVAPSLPRKKRPN